VLRVCRPVPRAELDHISSFGRGVLQMVLDHLPLLHVLVGGVVPRDGSRHLSHICGELPRASTLKGAECNTPTHLVACSSCEVGPCGSVDHVWLWLVGLVLPRKLRRVKASL
jgi:hypothetical protein